MNVFFDNCTSPVLSSTLHGYIEHRGHSAQHIRNLPCGPNASDLAWMEMLATSGAEWIVITGDGRISRNRAERAAFRRTMLKGFSLAPAYQKTPLHQVAATLIWRWPDMEDLMDRVEAPALFEVSIKRAGRFRSLPI